MDDIVERIKKAAEAIGDLPDDLRPVAFRYVLDQLGGERTSGTPPRGRGARSGRPKPPADGRAGARPSRKRTRRPASRPKVDIPKLKAFVTEKAPRNHEERYAVIAVYFHQDGVARIGDEHVRTCYTVLRWPRPGNAGQIFCNAHCRKHWFTERGEDGLRELTDQGRTFVMGELPRQ